MTDCLGNELAKGDLVRWHVEGGMRIGRVADIVAGIPLGTHALLVPDRTYTKYGGKVKRKSYSIVKVLEP